MHGIIGAGAVIRAECSNNQRQSITLLVVRDGGCAISRPDYTLSYHGTNLPNTRIRAEQLISLRATDFFSGRHNRLPF